MKSKPTRPHARTPARATPWAWGWAGLLIGAVLALLLCAPARWVAWGLAQASGGQVQLLNARGTVWDGQAQLVFSGGADSRNPTILPGPLQWRLRPRFTGLALELQAGCCTPQPLTLNLTPHWGGATVRLADGAPSHWPAALLAGLGTPWNTVQPEGQLLFSSTGLQLDFSNGRLRITGTARLDVLDLSTRLSTLRPLGNYRIDLQGGDDTHFDLRTLNGSLLLNGSGRWVGNRLHFEGRAAPAPQREEALWNLLNIMGRRDGASSIITLG